MDKINFDSFVSKHPNKKFNLHNGFAGFAYGMPSNPKWISNEKAFDILKQYEKLTNEDHALLTVACD